MFIFKKIDEYWFPDISPLCFSAVMYNFPV